MFKLNNLLRTLIFPLLLIGDFTWLLGFGWISLISFITLILINFVLIGYSSGIKKTEYYLLLFLILGNSSLMIHKLFQILWIDFSSVSMFFFVIGVFLSIRLIADSIDEFNS